MLNKELVQNKINYILYFNPEYRLYQEDVLLSILMDENILTQEEINMLKSEPSLFKYNFEDQQTDNYAEVFGLQINSKPAESTPKEKIDNILKQFDLKIIDEKLDLKDFTPENLIQKFNIEQNKINKTTLKPLTTTLEINHEKLGEIRVEFVEYKKDDMTIIISSNDFTIDIYNEEMLNYSERNLNGSEIISHKIYNKNGKIMYENIKNKITHYENGYPYIEINRNNEPKNLFVAMVENELKVKNLFRVNNNTKIKEVILNQITADNANVIVNDYKEETGRSLLSDIKKIPTLDNSSKEELIDHLLKISPSLLAQELVNNIYGVGSKNLYNCIKYLNKDNIQGVLYCYNKEAYSREKDFCNALKLDIHRDNNNIPSNVFLFLNDGIANGLIKNIHDEWNMSEKSRETLIEDIINIVIESIDNNKVTYAQDIKADILEHKNDIAKLDIDIMRYSNRCYATDSAKNITNPNGIIDSAYNQHGTGDCWLISTITSILKQPTGKKHIESLIKANNKTDCTEVYLAGAKKTYSIKNEYIKNSTHLADGDGDIRAIELAIESFLKEMAYDNKNSIDHEGKTIDIDGNFSNIAFKLLLGNGEYIKDSSNIDWNSKDIVYTVATGERYQKFINNNPSAMRLTPQHAYSVIKSDENYLYLYAPEIKIDINNIKEEDLIKFPLKDAKHLSCYAGKLSDIVD